MATARNTLVDLSVTKYYHCMARCVRRAYLCGDDPVTGRSFDHRKQWVVDRIKFLASVFAIDVCAYAVLSNHYHVVLHVNNEAADDWSNSDVIARWAKLFPADAMSVKSLADKGECEKLVAEKLSLWRHRLADISWYMRCLNETIARKANREDRCKGRFWEGRFKCQSLLDEAALLTCMTYVDLNPVRAGISSKVEEDPFTSIYERIQALASSRRGRKPQPRARHEQFQPEQYRTLTKLKQSEGIARLNVLHNKKNNQFCIPFDLLDYCLLLQQTAEVVSGKGNKVSVTSQEKLKDVGVNAEHWIASVTKFSQSVFQFLGNEDKLLALQESGLRRKIKGLSFSRFLYSAVKAA